MLIAEKRSLNYQVEGGSFSLKIWIMERDLYKQIKLAKTLNLNIIQLRKKGTWKLQPISLIC